LTIATQPSSSNQNGAPFTQQPVIQVVDRDGNPAPQGNVVITATVSSGPNGDIQNASATTDAAGQATFSGLSLTGAVGNYTISFSSDGLGGVTSNPIALTVGPPALLALAVSPPATTRSRAPLTPQPVIQVQDVSGNPAPQAGIAVAASITAGATLGGQSTVATGADGRATFTDLAIIGSPGQKTISFSSTSPTLPAVSTQITLPEVASIQLHPDAPASAVVGTTLTNVPIGILKDVAGQPVADAPFTLTASAGSVVPASGTSGDNGLVLAESWTLGTTTGDQYVDINVMGSVTPLRVHIAATPAPAANLLKVSGDNPIQTAPVDSALADHFVVQVTDQFGNGVGGAVVEWRGCDGAGDYSPTTDENGFSSARQPTGPNPGTFCTRASASGTGGPLTGSPAEFSYTVTAAAPSSMMRSGSGGVAMPHALPPGPPRPQGVRRPSSSVR
jgi:hypothetical protein